MATIKEKILYDHAPDAIMVVSADYKILDCNHTLEKLTGYKKEEIVNKSVFEIPLYDVDTLKYIRKLYKGVTETTIPKVIEYEIIKLNGEKAWLDVQISPIIWNNELVYQANIRDISFRKRLEMGLIELKEKYRLISENVYDLIGVINEKFQFEYLNKYSFMHTLGYTPEEIIGTSALMYIHPDDIEIAAEKLRESFKIGYGSAEVRFRHKKGHYIWIESKGKIFKSEDGKSKILIISRDITERKAAELKLKESEEKFRHLFETSPNMILLVNSKGVVIGANPLFLKYAGLCKDDLIGKKFLNIKWVTPQRKKAYTQVFEETLSTGNFGPIEFQAYVNPKRRRWIELKATLFEVEREKVIQVILQDIHNRKVTEEKLKQSEQNYREAYERAEFYRNLFSHDMNNILTTIGACSQIYSLSKNQSNVYTDPDDLFKTIEESLAKARLLISNVRNLYKLENEDQLSLDKTNMLKSMNEAISFIKGSFKEKDIEISLETESYDLWINGNQFLVNIFENLLNNAVKYNDQAVIQITVKISKLRIDNVDIVRIECIDNGIGIDDERKHVIFQEGNKDKKGKKGLGFGLSVVKKIVDQFNGKIWVEDRIEGDYTKGSNFIVQFPEYK